jgi:quercetin dioxygenase-like cupin family protein
MAIPHALPGQPIDVSPLGDRLGSALTTALFKGRDLEVMRLVLPAGKALPPHHVAGEITIHCLEGALQISLDERPPVVLKGAQMIYLGGAAVHGVVALEDSSALVTIALLGASGR